MFDKYHLTTIETIKKLFSEKFRNEKCVFELFIRSDGTYYVSKGYPNRVRKKIFEVIEFYGRKDLGINKISVANTELNSNFLMVKKFFPLVQIVGSIEAIILESALINLTQMELIYATRIKKIKEISKKYGIPVVDFGLRRAPSIESANLFSEIMIEHGLKTSNMNMYLKYPEMVIGTLPHAFVQLNAKDENYEIHLWKELILKGITNVILPDTYNASTVIKSLALMFKTEQLIFRIDSDHENLIKLIVELNKIFKSKHKVIVSGDMTPDKIENLIEKFGREIFHSFAVGTQVVNNIKPLSIVFKLVQVGDRKIEKRAKGKEQIPGAKYVLLNATTLEYELKEGLSPSRDTYVMEKLF